MLWITQFHLLPALADYRAQTSDFQITGLVGEQTVFFPCTKIHFCCPVVAASSCLAEEDIFYVAQERVPAPERMWSPVAQSTSEHGLMAGSGPSVHLGYIYSSTRSCLPNLLIEGLNSVGVFLSCSSVQ